MVARIGDDYVRMSDLDLVVGNRLARLRAEEYSVKRSMLQGLIEERLLAREARERGLEVAELLRVEIDQKVLEPTAEQARAVYEATRERYEGKSEVEAFDAIRNNMERQRRLQRRSVFIRDLTAKFGVKVMLEPPRFNVPVADGPSKGPRNAPVTIIEFSDFECPYCSRAASSLQQVLARYGAKVRAVFRNFPLPIHPNAVRAAEAAACAGDAGRYWEMHDKLFANQRNLRPADLNRYATEIGLKTEEYQRCMGSQKYRQKVETDKEDGERYGVSSTPTFFVNGRLLVGVLPVDIFAKVIDEELEWVASRGGKTQSSTELPPASTKLP
jgi:predicted DsbA family dithiol-disulfide isomerase